MKNYKKILSIVDWCIAKENSSLNRLENKAYLLLKTLAESPRETASWETIGFPETTDNIVGDLLFTAVDESEKGPKWFFNKLHSAYYAYRNPLLEDLRGAFPEYAEIL